MKKYIVSIVFVMIAILAFSQEERSIEAPETKKLTKEQRAEQRRLADEAMASVVDSIIQRRKFVLEADFLSNQSGNRVNVNSLLNFIIVDSSDIVIQVASTTGIGGPNGMGGVTTRGRISSFDVKKTGKNKDVYYIRLMANTTLGTYDIYLHVSPNSNADASLSGITPGKLNYHGMIKPMNKSRVFKGMAI